MCVSSWNRLAPNTLPAMAKAGANYMNSQLIKMEAIANGYAEGIALDVNGYVSEGSGENVFVVRDGVLHTPPLGNSVLPGITRDSVLQIAQELGIPVVEQVIPREMLYIADEVFFTGTAAEITPIRSVDKITVGKGAAAPSLRPSSRSSTASSAARNPTASIGSPRSRWDRNSQLKFDPWGRAFLPAANPLSSLNEAKELLLPFAASIAAPPTFFCCHPSGRITISPSNPEPCWHIKGRRGSSRSTRDSRKVVEPSSCKLHSPVSPWQYTRRPTR